MSHSEQQPDAPLERSTARVTLRFPADAYDDARLASLLAHAEHVARYVEKRLDPLQTLGSRPERVTVVLESLTPSDANAPAAAAVSDPDEVGRLVAEAIIRQRIGGAEAWRPTAEQADDEAIANVLDFLALGLARYLAAQADRGDPGNLFANRASGGAPRQSADQVCRQIAADREGKVPLYESMLRGPGVAASAPEHAALAESFCGYLFEREGPKAYRRLVHGSREDPNHIADLVYGKTLEQLQDEWLGAIVRGQGRKPVSIAAFARQVIPYLRPYTWQVILALMLMGLSALVFALVPFQIRDIIDIITKAAQEASTQPAEQNLDFFGDLRDLAGQAISGGVPNVDAFRAEHALVLETLGKLYAKIVIVTLIAFVNLCSVIWLVYIVNVVGQNILRDLRVQLTNRLHHLSASFYSRNRMGDMLARFTSDVARMADPLAEATAYSIYWVIFLAFTLVAMFAMSWQLSLVLFLIVPVYLVINRRFGPAMQSAARTRQERLAQLNAGLEEMLFGHSLIKAYGLGGHLMGRFRPKISEFRKVAIWADFLRAIYNEVIGIAENIQTKLVLALGGTLAVFGFMTTGTIIGFNGLAGRFITPLHKLGVIYAGIQIASASLRRVEEVLREPIEAMDVPVGGSVGPETLREGIRFENVSFSYTAAEPTLRDINLMIAAGEHVAFVGPTGAGKSTLVNLIPRFYDVAAGAITIDGQDIRSFSLAGLRRAISIVSQDTFLFASTIMENIRLGRLEASDDEVVEAAKSARLHDFILGLPAGYDTLVGERGSRLSGGQKQRVAIARALLRGSPVIILDEATSSLDAETESEILSELDEVTQGKTVISITHRLGLALKAERIYVLQAGRVVQSGSHEQLIRQTGLYRKLFEDQNRELMRRGVGDGHDVTLVRAQSAPSFAMVPEADLTESMHRGATERFRAGEVVCPRNGANGHLYLLRSGQVELTVHDEQGGEQRLAVAAPSGGNGTIRLSLVLSLPPSVSARAITDSEVQVLERNGSTGLFGGRSVGPRETSSATPAG